MIYPTPEQAIYNAQFTTQPGPNFQIPVQNFAGMVPDPAQFMSFNPEQYARSLVGNANSSFGLEQARMEAEIRTMLSGQQIRNDVHIAEGIQRTALMGEESAARVLEIETRVRQAGAEAAHRYSSLTRESEARIQREDERHTLEMDQIRQKGALERQLTQEESKKRADREDQPRYFPGT